MDHPAAFLIGCSNLALGMERKTKISDRVINSNVDGDPDRCIKEWWRSLGQSQVSGCFYLYTSCIGGVGMVFTKGKQEPLVVAHGHWTWDHPGLVCSLVSATQWADNLANPQCIRNAWTWFGKCSNRSLVDVLEGEKQGRK
jgi:hypothetical protein